MSKTPTAAALDDETTAALTLFNEYLDADRERSRREKRIKKAERAKNEAAAKLKRLAKRGSAREKTAAETAYRDASAAWRKLRGGEEPEPAPAKQAPAKQAPANKAAPVKDEEE